MKATPLALQVVENISAAFEAHRDPEAAAAMKAYMRDQFDFIGINAPVRVGLCRDAIAGLAKPDPLDLESASRALWAKHERDYQYAGAWFLRQNVKQLDSGFLPTAEHLITTKSWWDTVDDLAHHVVGPLVLADRTVTALMDEWIGSDNIWLARTAIIHQGPYKERTDADRLFAYCLRRAADKEFFLRKAIGWALRDYSKVDEAAVRAFVAEHDAELSGLSTREALKWLERRATNT